MLNHQKKKTQSQKVNKILSHDMTLLETKKIEKIRVQEKSTGKKKVLKTASARKTPQSDSDGDQAQPRSKKGKRAVVKNEDFAMTGREILKNDSAHALLGTQRLFYIKGLKPSPGFQRPLHKSQIETIAQSYLLHGVQRHSYPVDIIVDDEDCIWEDTSTTVSVGGKDVPVWRAKRGMADKVTMGNGLHRAAAFDRFFEILAENDEARLKFEKDNVDVKKAYAPVFFANIYKSKHLDIKTLSSRGSSQFGTNECPLC